MDWIKQTADGVELSIRAAPRASKNAVQGVLGDALKIRLQAPPVEGQANEALLDFLADELDVPPRTLRLISGETGRNKRVFIAGAKAEVVRNKLIK
ncbi:MAG TPA: hypothetical protein DCZ95_15115 [Verrucomicrobia bacterium]|nr:MAG: hypothetical protein A2X46_15425 [Lentisphaerae bacterium GWF2_57_35]HBA85415.1 hypothetical protein [Verrucomicrobiota bacterium]